MRWPRFRRRTRPGDVSRPHRAWARLPVLRGTVDPAPPTTLGAPDIVTTRSPFGARGPWPAAGAGGLVRGLANVVDVAPPPRFPGAGSFAGRGSVTGAGTVVPRDLPSETAVGPGRGRVAGREPMPLDAAGPADGTTEIVAPPAVPDDRAADGPNARQEPMRGQATGTALPPGPDGVGAVEVTVVPEPVRAWQTGTVLAPEPEEVGAVVTVTVAQEPVRGRETRRVLPPGPDGVGAVEVTVVPGPVRGRETGTVLVPEPEDVGAAVVAVTVAHEPVRAWPTDRVGTAAIPEPEGTVAAVVDVTVAQEPVPEGVGAAAVDLRDAGVAQELVRGREIGRAETVIGARDVTAVPEPADIGSAAVDARDVTVTQEPVRDWEWGAGAEPVTGRESGVAAWVHPSLEPAPADDVAVTSEALAPPAIAAPVELHFRGVAPAPADWTVPRRAATAPPSAEPQRIRHVENALPVVAAAPVTGVPLTDVGAGHVGEPREPERPHRSLTDFDRLVATYEHMPIAAALGMAVPELALPPPEPMTEWIAPQETVRRTTLGQSRRRGVGGYRLPGSTAPDDEPPDDEPPDDEPPHDQPRPRTGDRRWPPNQRPTADRRPSPAPDTADGPGHTCPDLADTTTLDDLAGRLYRHVRTRLRAELLVDRERSGMLADPM